MTGRDCLKVYRCGADGGSSTIVCSEVNWVYLAQDGDWWQNLSIRQATCNFFVYLRNFLLTFQVEQFCMELVREAG